MGIFQLTWGKGLVAPTTLNIVMKTLIITSVLLLSGCATGCREACVFGFGPGSSMFETVANHYDSRDPCQFKNKPDNYELPNYCGASTGKNIRITKGIGNNTYIVTRN